MAEAEERSFKRERERERVLKITNLPQGDGHIQREEQNERKRNREIKRQCEGMRD